MKNEALRIFLAVTALILTALLTNPVGSFANEEMNKKVASEAVGKTEKDANTTRKVAGIKVIHKATRSFAFFFKR